MKRIMPVSYQRKEFALGFQRSKQLDVLLLLLHCTVENIVADTFECDFLFLHRDNRDILLYENAKLLVGVGH